MSKTNKMGERICTLVLTLSMGLLNGCEKAKVDHVEEIRLSNEQTCFAYLTKHDYPLAVECIGRDINPICMALLGWEDQCKIAPPKEAILHEYAAENIRYYVRSKESFKKNDERVKQTIQDIIKASNH